MISAVFYNDNSEGECVVELIELLKAIVLGIVQGITEWLPISSTGHMILVNELMPLTVLADPVQNTEFVDMFMVVIQLGSILAVLLLYFNKLNPFSRRKNADEGDRRGSAGGGDRCSV